jgi:hypothetical protein
MEKRKPDDRDASDSTRSDFKSQGYRPSAADTPRLPAGSEAPKSTDQEVVAPAVDFSQLAGQTRTGYISPGARK